MTSVSPAGRPFGAQRRNKTPVGAQWLYGAGCGLGLAAATYAIAAAERLGPANATLAVAAALIVAALAALALVLSLRAKSARPAASHDLLVRAFAAGPEPWFITGPRDTVVEANGEARSFFGAALAGDGAVLASLFRGAAAAEVERLHGRAICGEAAGEVVNLPERGGPARVTCAPVANRPGYLLWTVSPVSKPAPETLRLQALERLVHSAPVGLFAAAGGRLTFVNETLAAWLGAARAELEDGANLLDFVVAEAQQQAPGLPSGTVRLRGAAGSTFAATVSLGGSAATVSRGGTAADDLVVGMIANHSLGPPGPIGDRRRPGSRRFFDAAPIGFVRLDGGGRIIESNDAFRELAGPEIDVDGAALAELVQNSPRIGLAARLAAARGGGALDPIEVRLSGEGGRTAELYTSVAEPGGSELFAYFVDTTGRKRLEEQLAQSQKMQAVGQLAGGIAHDFNNLLTAMIGFCDLLLLRHSAGDQSFADIMQIKQNANRAANLVRQLLAFSRQQTLQPKVLVLTDVLAELSHLLRRLIGERIKLRLVHNRDLGLVLVDQGQLEQVIINIVVNARDAMPDGGALTIRTDNVTLESPTRHRDETMSAGDYVLIEISDTGLGIGEEHLDKIFEPFFTTKAVGAGTGLGLSTVYGIIKQTGGFIFAHSAKGDGTTFKIFLPRHAAGAHDAVPVEEPAPSRDLTGSGTILLVEDEAPVRQFAARALANKGYKVLEADSGERALEVLAEVEGRIDMLVADVVMPGMDGPTLLQKVQEVLPDVKAVLISGYAEDVFRRGLKRNLDVAFLPKPFSLKELLGAVKENLEG